jgi:CheY-like chemotaxis protein
MTEPVRTRILLVDDEPHVLEALERQLCWDYDVVTATSGVRALELLREKPSPALLLSDMRMPGMDGATLLARAREASPDVSRLLLTGYADLAVTIEAVNRGGIFRFLVKPCAPDVLKTAIQAGVEQYRLVTSERELLEETLKGAVQALGDALSLASPSVFGHATRVRERVAELLEALEATNRWATQVAATVWHLPLVTLPPDTLERFYSGAPPTPAERRMLIRLPFLAERVITSIPRLEPVRAVLRAARPTTSAAPSPLDPALRLGAEVLRVALEFDALESRGLSPALALEAIVARQSEYDQRVIRALREVVGRGVGGVVIEIAARDVRVGMLLQRDVHAKNGMVILPKGTVVTESLRSRVRNFAEGIGVAEPVYASYASVPERDAKQGGPGAAVARP